QAKPVGRLPVRPAGRAALADRRRARLQRDRRSADPGRLYARRPEAMGADVRAGARRRRRGAGQHRAQRLRLWPVHRRPWHPPGRDRAWRDGRAGLRRDDLAADHAHRRPSAGHPHLHAVVRDPARRGAGGGGGGGGRRGGGAPHGLHVKEAHFLVGPLAPVTGEPVPDGTLGELVFTTVTKEALPLLRYRTGDIAALSHGPCACGRTLAKMSKVTGRIDDMLVIRGVNVYPSEIERVLLAEEALAPDYLLVVDERA